MSIIQEAIKKAQKTGEPNNTPARTQEASVVTTAPSGRSNDVIIKNSPRLYVYGAILFMVLAIVMVRVSVGSSKASANPATTSTNTAEKSQGVQEKKASSMFSSHNIFDIPKNLVIGTGEFVLSGIMQLTDGPRAAINDTMVAEGDRINGATVKKINNNSVVLQKRDSSEVTLELK